MSFPSAVILQRQDPSLKRLRTSLISQKRTCVLVCKRHNANRHRIDVSVISTRIGYYDGGKQDLASGTTQGTGRQSR